MNEKIIDGQPISFHALREVVHDAIRDHLENDGWVFTYPRDDRYPSSWHIVEFEGNKLRIKVELVEYRDGIDPKDPALLAAKETLKERRRAERPAA